MRNELFSVCGDRDPSIEDIPHLPFTRAAMCESQRLRSVVPVGIPHGCLQVPLLNIE